MAADPTPRPLPLRVLCQGASTVNWISYMGGSRHDMAYPRVVEGALLAAGRDAQVRDTSLAAEHPKDALAAWSREVVPWSPDVVVLHYLHMECLHTLLPRVLQRYAQSLQSRPGHLRDLYRQKVVRRGWRLLCQVQRRVSRRVPSALFELRARRAARDLERVVALSRMVGSPLVLLMELTEPGELYRDWFPGIEGRMASMNRTLAEIVERAGSPDVRLFRTRAAIGELVASGEPTAPDGAHFTPAAHRAIGQSLAAEIEAWSEASGHLETFARAHSDRSGTLAPLRR